MAFNNHLKVVGFTLKLIKRYPNIYFFELGISGHTREHEKYNLSQFDTIPFT